jgi:hypothetical protein
MDSMCNGVSGEVVMQTLLSIDGNPELKRIFEALRPGDEVVVTLNNQPIGKILPNEVVRKGKLRPPPGLGKGMIDFVAPDFDAPLECLKEYME